MKRLWDQFVDFVFALIGSLISRAWSALRSAFAALLIVILPFAIVWLVGLCPHFDMNAGQYEGMKTVGLLGFGFFMVWRTKVLETFVKAVS